MQAAILGWKVYALTQDPLSLGMVGLAEAVPAISVALYAGHIADKHDRKRILLLMFGVLLFASSTLTFLASSWGQAVPFQLQLIYGIIFLTGFARGFMGPTFFAFMSQLVPKHVYPNSSTWNSSSLQTGMIAGPALGGLVYGFCGELVAMASVATLVVVSFVAFTCIPSQPLPEKSTHESMVERLTGGIKFVFKNKFLTGALSLDLFAVLFGGATALLPVFANDILKVGPEGFGFLRSAPAVGSILCMIGMIYFPIRHNVGRKLFACVTGFGLCMIGFGLSESYWLSLILLMVGGMFDGVSVIVRSTILQMMTPDNMRGRVSAVNSMFIGSSNEIGAFESGVTARWFGAVYSVVVGGCMTLVVVALARWRVPELTQLNFVEKNTE